MTSVTELFEQPPLITSEALAWRGVRVEQYRLDAVEIPAHYHAHHLLIVYEVPTHMIVRHPRGSQVQERAFRTGDLGLYPGGEYNAVTCNAPCDNIYLTVDDQHLKQLSQQSRDLTKFTLRDRFHFNDPLLLQLGRQLIAAVGSQHALGLLYVESLTNALCHQLIEHHATCEHRVTNGRTLPATVLARIDAYLEAHAERPVTLETLAGLANLSVFHFSHLFKQATGVPPYRYVLNWKICRARRLLRAGHTSVADISDALGFASPANFSVAFKRIVGCSPLEFSRGKSV
ncbi:helix-turn-helix transcriptional regulator [Spirosoma utsteinense]|uniref:AraC family transcriptional regulator n=1 Tax=Spirosoma utsteinense TaxID=2585773 RepID=A0ABR6WF45_9BACT|nr:AraC family transcriptional regulator [Spirosoma utsteinense]MBC3788672.1 AraC family transcriptional regulator [Spirosoma utsteinense]MBC3794636.1 AraC family transcriptional regulator [Spirosoma utsteinense]